MSFVLEARQLTKRFGSFTAVNNVSLEFQPGLIHAVLGENGAGKSTLMKLLFGLHHPDEGTIALDGKAVSFHNSMAAIAHGLGMVQQHFALVDTLSAIDNIMLGAEACGGFGHLQRVSAIRRLEELLPSRQLAVPWNAKVGELGVGQKQRVEILKLLYREAKILFLDEPTAVLTPTEIEEFFAALLKLKASGRTIVLITHKINEVLQICDTYSVLRHGSVVATGAVKGADPERIVESMIGFKLPEFNVSRQPVTKRAVLDVDGVSDAVLRDVRLRVHAGEIVGIAGVEGSGQSQLVDAIMGLSPVTGQVKILGQAAGSAAVVRGFGVGLVPEDRLSQGLWLDESCHVNLALGVEERFYPRRILNRKELETKTDAWARSFDVRAPSLRVSVRTLSGGNQQKIIFAREVVGRSIKLLLCHQPTRGVDLGAVDTIHRHLIELRNKGVATLLISSELDELLKLSDRICVLFGGRVVGEFARAEFSRQTIGRAMTGMQNAH